MRTAGGPQSAEGTEAGGLHLVGGRLLARNAMLNLAGQGAPLLVAILAIPVLVAALGTARFGVLTLAWMVIGYFSLFDLGLGRALTQRVAGALGEGRAEDVPVLSWTGFLLMAGLGILGGIAIAVAAPALVDGVLNIPADLEAETLRAMRVLALSLPVVVLTTGVRGLLEAYQRFDLVNLIRAPMGAFTFAGPLLVLPFSTSLVAVVAVLLLGRVIALVAHFWAILRAVPEIGRGCRVDRACILPLMRFGGWMTVSNVVSPLMVYFDRFIVAILLSVTAVAYYVTPYEVVSKLLIIPAAVMGVLFPAIATSMTSGDSGTPVLVSRALRLLVLLVFPLVLVLVTWAPEILRVWLGGDFAENSGPVLRWLAVGMFINSLAQVPFTVVQAAGRPDLTAKLHLIELPLYLAVGFWLVSTVGLVGAAIAWVLRAAVDAAALFVIALRLLPGKGRALHQVAVYPALALLTLWLGVLPHDSLTKAVYVVGVLIAFIVFAWRLLLAPGERRLVLTLVRSRG